MKIKISKSNFLLLLAQTTLVVIFETILTNVLANQKTIDNLSSPESEEFIVDNINDGVFKSTKHGYSFEYPSDRFNIKYVSLDEADFVYNNEGSNNKLILNTMVAGNTDRKLYDEIYKLNTGEVYKNDLYGTFKKIEGSDFGKYKQVKYLYQTNPSSESTKTISYSTALIADNKPIILLNFFTEQKFENILKQYKSVFDEIEKSLVLED